MEAQTITLYGIGGLGADHRVFQNLTINCNLIPITWEVPENNESITSYAKRIVSQIDQQKKFGLIGVSFGGIIALELSKIIDPEFIILISSVSQSTHLPWYRIIGRKLNILPILPNAFLKPPFLIMKYLFSAKNSRLLREIIHDTDPKILRWALSKLIKWESNEELKNVHLIHGTDDKIIPLKNESAFPIEGGGHFMIVDKAQEISHIIDDLISQYS